MPVGDARLVDYEIVFETFKLFSRHVLLFY